MDKRRVIYYKDEQNDEFSLAKITPRKIDGGYVYVNDSLFKRFTRFFWYRIVAMPLAFLYTKLKFAHKIVGASKMKGVGSYFLYGNHTQDIADALIPNMINKTREKYVIVHPNNVSIPVIGKIAPSLGALPLPDDIRAQKNFSLAIEQRLSEGAAIVVYPEAHIWPYYTKIRPFADTSFHYPVKHGVPVFCFTNTYERRRFTREARIVTYVDGPFYPKKGLSPREQRRALRDEVYGCMCERAKASNYTLIEYVRLEDEND